MKLENYELTILRDACTAAALRHARSCVKCGENPEPFHTPQSLCSIGFNYVSMDKKLRAEQLRRQQTT